MVFFSTTFCKRVSPPYFSSEAVEMGMPGWGYIYHFFVQLKLNKYKMNKKIFCIKYVSFVL